MSSPTLPSPGASGRFRELLRLEIERALVQRLDLLFENEAPELVGSREVASMLGIRRENLSRWRRRHPSFPAPLHGDRPGGRPRWRRADVIAWLSRPLGRGEGWS